MQFMHFGFLNSQKKLNSLPNGMLPAAAVRRHKISGVGSPPTRH